MYFHTLNLVKSDLVMLLHQMNLRMPYMNFKYFVPFFCVVFYNLNC